MRELFRNHDTTEFMIVTIPTMMAVNESQRLLTALREEGVPCGHVVVNQLLTEDRTNKEAFLSMKSKDQRKAMQQLEEDPALRDLEVVEAKLFDLDVRGVGALGYFGDQVWK